MLRCIITSCPTTPSCPHRGSGRQRRDVGIPARHKCPHCDLLERYLGLSQPTVHSVRSGLNGPDIAYRILPPIASSLSTFPPIPIPSHPFKEEVSVARFHQVAILGVRRKIHRPGLAQVVFIIAPCFLDSLRYTNITTVHRLALLFSLIDHVFSDDDCQCICEDIRDSFSHLWRDCDGCRNVYVH